MTLNGYDLSSHNTTTQVATALASDFVILKATEGISYTWSDGPAVAAKARAAGKLVGWYHFARPEFNGPEAEARYFISTAKALPGEALILDFEPSDIQPAYPAWVTAFANAIETWTGAPCWFYTNQYQGNAMVKLASPEDRDALHAMPLWKAYYQASIGDLMGWPDWTCWQKTSTPFDTNEFNGDAAKWRALGVPEDTVADATLSQATIDAIGKAAADAVYARRFPKQTNPKDTTSLGDLIVWSEPVALGQADRIIAAVKALPVEPTAEEIAEAVVALMPDGTDPAQFLDALRARLES